MQKIKYYDEINRKEIDLEVTDKVAEELKILSKNEDKAIKQIKRNEIVMDICDLDNYIIDEFDILENLIKKEEVQEKYRKHQNRKELLKKALLLLTDKEKEVISGIFDQKLTQAELAKKLNISRSAVKQRYDSAMCKIKEFIINNE
jgi:RNA polymerase sigma factor (sigma-70 family)